MIKPSLQVALLIFLAIDANFSIGTPVVSTRANILPRDNTTVIKCRCFPGEDCWPDALTWYEFNSTLGGKLISTVPIGSPCHHNGPTGYLSSDCATLQSVWYFPQTHYESPSSIMAPFFANQSCSPFLPESSPCTLGNYVQYTVNASDASDFQKTIDFVTKNNIRLTVRNTGHDYNGKATGAGAVAIWTHNMKSIEFLDYDQPYYTGKAIKMGAGVQAIEAYTAAQKQKMLVVGGNCPTVGLAGGYSQGGGHGPLASKFGLGADQTLEWEVVTGDGQLVTATPANNSDLYWALSGGGGGTYGAVVSLTSKAYSDLATTAANLTFPNAGTNQTEFWDVFETFHGSLPRIVDSGSVAIFLVTNESFSLMPLTAPGLSKDQVDALMQPTLDKLNQYQITYEYLSQSFDSYLDSYHLFNSPWDVSQYQIGGRLVPRSLLEKNNTALTSATKNIIESGAIMTGTCINVSRQGISQNSNAVNPYWRESIYSAVIGTPWSETDWGINLAYQTQMTDTLLPNLENLTPKGGAYLNEADFQQPDFQQVFYGDHYDRLNGIKAKYDPNDIFYALTAVGSERWAVDRSGKLCQTRAV